MENLEEKFNEIDARINRLVREECETQSMMADKYAEISNTFYAVGKHMSMAFAIALAASVAALIALKRTKNKN